MLSWTQILSQTMQILMTISLIWYPCWYLLNSRWSHVCGLWCDWLCMVRSACVVVINKSGFVAWLNSQTVAVNYLICLQTLQLLQHLSWVFVTAWRLTLHAWCQVERASEQCKSNAARRYAPCLLVKRLFPREIATGRRTSRTMSPLCRPSALSPVNLSPSGVRSPLQLLHLLPRWFTWTTHPTPRASYSMQFSYSPTMLALTALPCQLWGWAILYAIALCATICDVKLIHVNIIDLLSHAEPGCGL